jgi:hypothetical protein
MNCSGNHPVWRALLRLHHEISSFIQLSYLFHPENVLWALLWVTPGSQGITKGIHYTYV